MVSVGLPVFSVCTGGVIIWVDYTRVLSIPLCGGLICDSHNVYIMVVSLCTSCELKYPYVNTFMHSPGVVSCSSVAMGVVEVLV